MIEPVRSRSSKNVLMIKKKRLSRRTASRQKTRSSLTQRRAVWGSVGHQGLRYEWADSSRMWGGSRPFDGANAKSFGFDQVLCI